MPDENVKPDSVNQATGADLANALERFNALVERRKKIQLRFVVRRWLHLKAIAARMQASERDQEQAQQALQAAKHALAVAQTELNTIDVDISSAVECLAHLYLIDPAARTALLEE